ncbi:MAG TPA: flagellar motor protein MotA [Cryomorphaceae bacterium]|jgi:biopolymer transport protein ExbB|nr:MAG: flagellar motor protein MotA [Cryomorphaceae bacterium BACL7 MAG-120910-bin2]KRO69341.1 MAG: flagellar motor protein MotA [Cryomorphaceae bacterium BACL7 MAG-120322-bin74]KRO83343.1 MAG: flagellar motor protein MotA [Cryomorphaceae bacterium BACL7 MAG-121220-bin83]NQW25326.1 MotA/TolQ/ExbB proton channel family protein [Cryomorphaceae bacterium]HAB31786.1 flagellar motor protein MotA [Cryomorphaceae bacterium]
MKKVFTLLLIAGVLFSSSAFAQEATEAAATEMVAADESVATDSNGTAATASTAVVEEAVTEEAAPEEEASFSQVLKKQFIDGGPFFMSFVLLALVLGLALVIERILYLAMSTSNNDKLLADVEEALNNGGVDAAKEVCRATRGPVASIFYNGLDKMNDGIDMVDKAIVSVGSVENGKLERGVSWISLFIALAPMLGFMGTVIGMIDAFDAIEAAGDISPSLVAGGIKVALLTTVFGLITAMILQVFYNLIIAMIDNIVNKMEDASISFLDLVAAYQEKNK